MDEETIPCRNALWLWCRGRLLNTLDVVEPQHTDTEVVILRHQLLGWYDAVARQLPWRDEPTPYHVLLSELMLQQTRVETVRPYYHRFVKIWPTMEQLAAADEDDVVREWSGLGYYSRARNLHRAARRAVEMGGLPSDVAGLLQLPGIGPYTAGAIASIAYGLRVPAVDGNVERVISRLDALENDPHRSAGRRAILARMTSLQCPERPGDFTQAVMELGAMVCTPKTPDCTSCPWQMACVAYDAGRVQEFPRKRKKSPPRPVYGVAGLLIDGGTVLMGKRAPGLLGGLWEPIGIETSLSRAGPEAVVEAFAIRAGLKVDVIREVGQVTHVFTHRRLTQRVFSVRADGEVGVPDGSYLGLQYVDPVSPKVALSTLARKTAKLMFAPTLPLVAETSSVRKGINSGAVHDAPE